MVNEQRVILVNEQDHSLGSMEKMEAHEKGVLHRAFSVFIFSSKGEMLLQQRAAAKYHSAGLWSNACCSHPFPGEQTQSAAERRLREELGFSIPLNKITDFIYRVHFQNGLIENEFDHVYVGIFDGPVAPDPGEVMNFTFQPMNEVLQNMEREPGAFTEWFKICLPKVLAWHKTAFPPNASDA